MQFWNDETCITFSKKSFFSLTYENAKSKQNTKRKTGKSKRRIRRNSKRNKEHTERINEIEKKARKIRKELEGLGSGIKKL